MKEPKIQIYVVTHSEVFLDGIITDEIHTPLFVGRNGRENFGILSDDNFEGNISDKNNLYSELTGLYWICHQSTADIIGLSHYRRYFKSKNGEIITKAEILDYLTEYDIIVPEQVRLIKENVIETYKEYEPVFEMSRRIISEEFPDYLPAFDRIMNHDSFSGFNMFIASADLMREYCSWIFTILRKIEKKITFEEYPRVLGLISESLFNVWFESNDLKIKEVPIYYLGDKFGFGMKVINYEFVRKFFRFLYRNNFTKPLGQKFWEYYDAYHKFFTKK